MRDVTITMGNDLLFMIERKLQKEGVSEPFTVAHELMHIIASHEVEP